MRFWVFLFGEKTLNHRTNDLLSQALSRWKNWVPEVYSNSAEPPKIIEKLKSGKTNESFIVGFHGFKSVVRVNYSEERKLGINREREDLILRLLRYKSFVPKIFFNDKDIQIREFICGRTPKLSELKISKYREQLEFYLNEVQEIDVKSYERKCYLRYIKDYEAKLGSVDTKMISVIEEAARFIDESHWSPVIVHNDLIPENMILSGDKLYLIDWEYADFAHPMTDRFRIFGKDDYRFFDSNSIVNALEILQDGVDYMWLKLRAELNYED